MDADWTIYLLLLLVAGVAAILVMVLARLNRVEDAIVALREVDAVHANELGEIRERVTDRIITQGELHGTMQAALKPMSVRLDSQDRVLASIEQILKAKLK